MGFCDRWEIGQGLIDIISLKKQKFCDNRDWDSVIDERLGKGDKSSLNNQKICDFR